MRMPRKKIAEERIRKLFEQAEQKFEEERELSDRYIELARKISMSEQVSIPQELKKSFCSECKSFLRPGVNCQIRINSKKETVNYQCKECGNVDRYGF